MIGLIGGTGVYDPELLEGVRSERVTTPYGDVEVDIGSYRGVDIAFLARHGKGHSIPPHAINYRANIWGLKALGVRRVLATAAVGSLNPDMTLGHVVVIDQFLDFTKSRPTTFFDGQDGVVHTDVTQPYCPSLRGALTANGREMGLTVHPEGVYVCVEGPRFETAAEIRAFRMLGGDVVGMTSVPECVLAREIGLCYAGIAMVTNMAAGIAPGPLTHEDVAEVMQANLDNVRELAMRTAVSLASAGDDPTCACR